MSKVANAHALRALLKRPRAGLNKLMLQALFRPLLNEPGVLKPITVYPPEGLPRISPEKFARNGPYVLYEPSETTHDVIRTTETWLLTAIARRDAWLRNVDRHGRVLRLRGLKCIDDVMELAEADFVRYRAREPDTAPEDDAAHVRRVLVLPDGLAWVLLVAVEAFVLEGRRMRHCIGNGRYWRQYLKGICFYYSLRDAAGRPRVTVEVCDGFLWQARGTANSPALPRWEKEITALCAEIGASAELLCGGPRQRLAALTGSAVPPVQAVSEVIDGDLRIDADTGPMQLPASLHVRGNLSVTQCAWLQRLPHALRVEGDCAIVACPNLWAMPRDLEVHGNASFVASSGLRWPSNRYEIWGNLDVSACDRLQTLFAHGWIGGHLDISDCPQFKELQQGLRVGGSIRCGDFVTTSVPRMNAFLSARQRRTPNPTGRMHRDEIMRRH